MARHVDLVPDFVAEVGRALAGEGRTALASQVRDAEVERCTFDRELGAGYIHFRLATVAEKVSFREPHWFAVEVGGDGNVVGIELFSRDEVFAQLRERLAPGAFVDV